MESSVSEEVITNEIKPKMHFTGTILKVGLAGAIIDIGVGKPAGLHISQVVSADDQPIKRLEDVLKVGAGIDVWVKKVKDERVELTMIRPLDLEWRDIKKGMTVKGKVVRLEKFGAFVEIGAERPGLIHISEMAHGYVRTPGDVLKENDEVEAQVIDVNRRKKQIKLSLKALQPEPVKEEEPVHMFEAPKRERVADKDKDKDKARRRTTKKPRSKDNEMVGDVDELMAGLNGGAEAENEPTAMEIAIREAMEKAKTRKAQADKRKKAALSVEQEDILNRTLEQKAQTN